MKDHEKRVVVEYNDVVDKLNALRHVIYSPKPSYITDVQYELLHQQYGIMSAYANVLNTRIEDFTKEQH